MIIYKPLYKYKNYIIYKQYENLIKKYFNTYFKPIEYTYLKKEELLLIRQLNIISLKNLINKINLKYIQENQQYELKKELINYFETINLLLNLKLKVSKIYINNNLFNYKTYYLNKLQNNKNIIKDSILLKTIINIFLNNTKYLTINNLYEILIKDYINNSIEHNFNFCSEYESENIYNHNKLLNLLLFKDLYLEELLQQINKNIYSSNNLYWILLIIYLIKNYIIKLHFQNDKYNITYFKNLNKTPTIKKFLKQFEIYSKF